MTVAVGFFDGVHLGHQAILAGAGRALTFTNHPLSVVAPDRAPRLIMTADERLAAIRAAGVPQVTALDFTHELANESPETFLRHLLDLTAGEPLAVRCGANWRFGKGGAGDADWLRSRGVAVTVVPYAVHAGEPISSTRVRAALEAGRPDEAAAMMGRVFALHGEVRTGKGVGRTMGFPTVNLIPGDLQLSLPRGVYAVAAEGVRGVANYGLAPTMGDRAWEAPVLEIHFLAEPPARVTRVELLRYLRPERRFESLAALQAQIARDRDACMSV